MNTVFILIMQINLQKLLSNQKLFSFISFNKMNSKSYIRLNNTIVKYILNHTKEEQYCNFEFINDSYIFKDLNLALYSLNDIYNKSPSIFIINKIKKLFEQINTNVKFFLELIKRQVNNDYVFDYLFNSFNENELNELYKDNINIMIVSLYKYSEINGVKYIQTTINNLKKFMSEDDLKRIIFPQNIFRFKESKDFPDCIIKFLEESKKIKLEKKEELKYEIEKDYKNNKNKKKRYNPEDKIEKYEKEYFQKYDKNKYLLFYALFNQKIPNYETIAYLSEQTQFEYFSYFLTL